MHALLDSHVLLWLDGGPKRLRPQVREALADPATHLYVSAASLWELQLKFGKGRLPEVPSVKTMWERMRTAAQLRLLHIQPEHLWRMSALPDLHGDPFDRLLVAQAQHERLTLVTADTHLARYPVEILW
ncbi:MAG: type II toxin-antitoxin system VapC family toxin [Betaproteobacteria bacterium]|nr:type II toxin-antitoxin system VapC family toxin [Betaproteobacteria bacterium]